MSNYTTTYNALITRLASLFPSKTRIPQPYSLQDNDDNMLRSSYGLLAEGFNNTSVETYCQDRFIHSFTIVLTQYSPRLNHDVSLTDSFVLSLKEDQISLMRSLIDSTWLGHPTGLSIINVNNCSGILSEPTEKGTILKVEVNFTAEIYYNRT